MPAENHFATLSDDEIDLIIGEAILSQTFGAKPQSDNEKRALAREWFVAHLPVFANAICDGNGPIQRIVGAEQKDRNLLIGEILDAVLKSIGVPVPVGALTVKIIHFGVDRLCRECL
ncbi:hypothetical protein [Burkholderia ubonensis]|uniref:hypothetical protein n=1 Tax=Burkholderia ubonensis TaxID=101571 RepID=UPI0012F9B257|nr:hypothetical protein [Burkholderia ubonensis]